MSIKGNAAISEIDKLAVEIEELEDELSEASRTSLRLGRFMKNVTLTSTPRRTTDGLFPETAATATIEFAYDVEKMSEKDGIDWHRVKLSVVTSPGQLKEIERVIYLLDDSFDPHETATNNVDSKFTIEIETWEDLVIIALVHLRSDSYLAHYLPIILQKK